MSSNEVGAEVWKSTGRYCSAAVAVAAAAATSATTETTDTIEMTEMIAPPFSLTTIEYIDIYGTYSNSIREIQLFESF